MRWKETNRRMTLPSRFHRTMILHQYSSSESRLQPDSTRRRHSYRKKPTQRLCLADRIRQIQTRRLCHQPFLIRLLNLLDTMPSGAPYTSYLWRHSSQAFSWSTSIPQPHHSNILWEIQYTPRYMRPSTYSRSTPSLQFWYLFSGWHSYDPMFDHWSTPSS